MKKLIAPCAIALMATGCATALNTDVAPTSEESEYMGFVASQDEDASAERGCVSFTVSEVIARAQIGEQAQTAVSIENSCGLDVPVRAAELINADGSMSLATSIPSVIPADSVVDVLVDFEAQADIIHTAELRILVEDRFAPVRIAEIYGLVPSSSERSGAAPNAATGGGSFSGVLGTPSVLDGSSSSDPENDALTYLWSFKSVAAGSSLTDADISGANSVTGEFTSDVGGDYRIRLIVSDGTSIDKTFATYSISGSANTRPVADAGPVVSVATGDPAQLDGSNSSDPDSDPLSFTWLLQSPASGSSLTSSDISSASASVASLTPDVDGFYVMKLRVNDGVLSDKDFTTIYTSSNSAPDSDAGANQTVSLGAVVSLDGSGSSDPDGDSINYTWSFKTLPSGSSLATGDIVDRLTAASSFTPDVVGSYRVRLTVDDGSTSAVDFVDITVE